MADQRAPRDTASAKQAIMELNARYFRYMDTRDWAPMHEVFAPDAVMDMRYEIKRLVQSGFPELMGGGLMHGREKIVASMAESLQGTVHHGHMPEIEFLSATEARGIWSMEDIVRHPEGGPFRELHGYGYYHEDYVSDDDGRWRIKSLRLTRLHITLS